MRSTRYGFTLIEMVIALVIGTILVSIAAPGVNSARGRFAVTGARSTFSSLHARARAQAVERATTVTFVVDAAGDSVSLWSAGKRLETVRFGGEMHVDIRVSPGVLRQCMTARGYADPDCNNFITAPKVTFWQNGDSASVIMLPMGQLVY